MIRRALAALTAATVGTLLCTVAPATAAERDPVVIVAGTLAEASLYEPMANALQADGYQVAVFELTDLGVGDIAVTARNLASFVDSFRATTGAARVDLIGHSQGGIVERQYIRFAGGESVVDSAIALAAPQYGTDALAGNPNCVGALACEQMAVGSTFLAALNANDDTPGAARYTNFYTAYDEAVRPVGNATLRDGADNVLIQDQCPGNAVTHVGLAVDAAVYSGIRQALEGQPIRLAC